MQSKESNKSCNVTKGQKTLLNFFPLQADRDSNVKCLSCNDNFPASKITWHRDFECVVFKKFVNKNNVYQGKSKKKNTRKKSKMKLEAGSSSESPDIIILDDVNTELSNADDRRAPSPSLFELESCNNCEGNQDLDRKESLVDILKKDWETPVKSSAKLNLIEEETVIPSEFCDTSIDVKNESMDFSVISINDSGDEFENNETAFSSPTNLQKKNKKKLKSLLHSPLKKKTKLLMNDNMLATTCNNVTNEFPIKLEKTFSDASVNSYENTPLHSPTLVSPERTPTPSPNTSETKRISSSIKLSSSILYSPNRFQLSKKLNIKNESQINSSPGCSNLSNKKRTPRYSLQPDQKINVKIESRTAADVCCDLLTAFNSAENSVETNYSPTKRKSMKQSPYKYRHEKGMYLNNFLLIIDSVTSQPQDLLLFNDNDLKFIKHFHNVSLPAQKLFIRIFQRKVKWNKVSKIMYNEICDQEDIVLYVNELVYAELFLSESHLTDLSDLAKLLDLNEIRKICRDMKIDVSGKKEKLIANLMKFDRQQKSILDSFSQSEKGESRIIKMIKDAVGKCFIINKEVWSLFMRVLHLFSPAPFDEDDESGQQVQLITLLLVAIGKMRYPAYTIKRVHAIYRSREDLLRFLDCLQLENEIQECIKNQEWEEGINFCKHAEESFSTIESDQEILNHDAGLPTYLRRYTILSLLCHIRSLAVEIYQRQKHYGKAVKQLQQLLLQKTHLQDYRGRWYDRLALNLHQHLKKPEKALIVIKEALEDPEVRVGYQLALSQRAEKILNSKLSQKFASDYEDQLKFVTFQDAPKICIQGKSLPVDNPGYKRVFISTGDDNETTMCSVEELALNYYKREGYPKGLHSEGRVVSSLFGFFFWDIIYLPLPDVFRMPHQIAPLDMNTLEFYKLRKKEIDKRLKKMEKWSLEKANESVSSVWIKHENCVCLIDWKIFSSLETLQGLIAGLGMKVIAAICKRLATDHRFTRSGFPDLVVWNPTERKSRIVEVKGPNDKLSTKQILWLDYLVESGATAEVCHVEAVGIKRAVALKATRISPRSKINKKQNSGSTEKSSQENETKDNQREKKGVKRKFKK